MAEDEISWSCFYHTRKDARLTDFSALAGGTLLSLSRFHVLTCLPEGPDSDRT